jgi:hypothetical protein
MALLRPDIVDIVGPVHTYAICLSLCPIFVFSECLKLDLAATTTLIRTLSQMCPTDPSIWPYVDVRSSWSTHEL